MLFNFIIFDLINLKNVIPKEKISHFSGINYPISYFYIIYLINSGAISIIVPPIYVFANVFLLYFDAPKSDNFISNTIHY